MCVDDAEVLKQARALFEHYNGSHFHMSRDGDYETYKQFGITLEQEKLWAIERRESLLSQLKTDEIIGYAFLNLVAIVSQFNDLDGFKRLIGWARTQQCDLFSQLLCAEQLLELAKRFAKIQGDELLCTDAKTVAGMILTAIASQPFNIIAEHNMLIDEATFRERVKSALVQAGCPE